MSLCLYIFFMEKHYSVIVGLLWALLELGSAV